MARGAGRGRPLSGVLVLDKASGMTSNRALQLAKRLFDANKAGHTGALDPLATGVLPICFGEATKFSQFLLDADKGYRITACFGRSTTTLDAEGEVTGERDASALTGGQLEQALAEFRGWIDQIPPMYSALKQDGRPLYELARRGEEVERQPRRVRVDRLELLEFSSGPLASATLEVDCSKGFYIRSLIADLGERLGTGAHVTALRRIRAGNYLLQDAHSLESLELERGGAEAAVLDRQLLPLDSPLAALPSVILDGSSAEFFIQGQSVIVAEVYRFGVEGDIVRVFAEGGSFLGVAEVSDGGRVKPKRLIASRS